MNIGLKEVVYIVFLTGILLFLSVGLRSGRIAETHINPHGIQLTIVTEYYGTPFEMVGFWWYLPDYTGGLPGMLVVVPGGLLADAAIYSLCAFVIVFALSKVRNDRERKRYYSAK